ncbi:hypothetical protein ABIF14_009671 [Bradyrhizobium elkanii]
MILGSFHRALYTMTAQREYAIKAHAPSDLGRERAVALFEFREPHERRSTSLHGD